MARPWQTLDRQQTADGLFELRRRGERDYLICLDGRVLMTSAAHVSELALAELAAEPIAHRRAPRMLIGGLGMGYTLRGALDVLPPRARVSVAELHPVVIEWCRGPLAELTGGAVLDPRVQIEVGDVSDTIRQPPAGGYHAIALDLFAGPQHPGDDDPHFGRAALERTRAALASGGLLTVWSEQHDAGFERGLRLAGFAVERRRAGRGGRRHCVYLAVRGDDTPAGRRRAPGGRRRSSAR